MDLRRPIFSIASCGLLVVSMSATRFAVAARVPSSVHGDPEACTLLTPADVSTAIEASSKAGKRITESSPKECIWSSDPAASDTSRRVALAIVSTRAFGFASRPAISTIKVEPIAGIGDEAFYQVYPNNASPFIWVRKGNTALSIRILTRLKPQKPFTLEQEKAKEAVLAKAAVAKL
jgi:hypothetical protein